ncbi:MAG: CoA transferase, partial [Phenylobacterium sp.]
MVAQFDQLFAQQPFAHWAKILHDGDVTFGIVGQIYDHLGDE